MAKRYDEDYEYYVPAVRNYSKGNKSESTADESESADTQEVKKKRGRPPGKLQLYKIVYVIPCMMHFTFRLQEQEYTRTRS